MEEFNCSSWEEFEKKVSTIVPKKRKINGFQLKISSPLFRGQESADWKLETTLERFLQKNFKMHDYFNIISAVKPAVKSLTEKSWELPLVYNPDIEGKSEPPLGYEFMVYLRHHGFPSPFLDWTRSPYVAAFFAFRSKQNTKDKHIAIYSYVEFCGTSKGITDDEAFLVELEPYITTHSRHFAQQSQYTICKKRVDKEFVYCPHEEAFSRNTEGQDRLTKFILPQSERAKVLEKLNFMNVNAYSLFGNEEGLMETLAYQEIEKRFLNSPS